MVHVYLRLWLKEKLANIYVAVQSVLMVNIVSRGDSGVVAGRKKGRAARGRAVYAAHKQNFLILFTSNAN